MTFRDMFDLTDYISLFLWSFETLRFWTLLHLIARYHKHLSLTFGLNMAISVGFWGDFLYFSLYYFFMIDEKLSILIETLRFQCYFLKYFHQFFTKTATKTQLEDSMIETYFICNFKL